MKGWVKAWFDQKGYDFIVPDDGSEDVFAHVNQVESHLDSLAPNALVSFELVITADGRRQAQDIILLDASSTEARPAVQHTPRPEAPASPPARREPLFTPERRSELAEEGAATLLAVMKIKTAGEDDPSYARLDAVRLMFDVLHKDTGGDP